MTERFIFMKFQKKKNLPHAYHEAKIYMALFKQYQVINELETLPDYDIQEELEAPVLEV